MANPVPVVNLSLYKNSTFSHEFAINDDAGSPVDLTGYTAKLDMRASSYLDDALYQATDADDLTIDVAGTVTLLVPATTVEAWTFDTAQYDLVVLPAGSADAALCKYRGTVTVYPHITDI